MPETRVNKPWPVRVTGPIAAAAVDAAATGDEYLCRRLTINLLRRHMQHMVPYGERWVRAKGTVAMLETIAQTG